MKIERITGTDFHKVASMVLRAEDAREIITASGISNLGLALRTCILESTEWTELLSINGEPLLLFGLSSVNSMIGVPWCLGSPLVYKYKKILHAYSKKVVSRMLGEFPLLSNYVDSRNTAHIHWLRRLGFTFPEGQGVEIRGVWFHYFYKEKV